MNNSTDSLTFEDIRMGAIYIIKPNADCVKVSDKTEHGTVVGQSWSGKVKEYRADELGLAGSDDVKTWVQLTRERRDNEEL